MDFQNFFTIYVFEVKESIADIPFELRCLIDLENPSQLPVREVLMILSWENFWNLYTIRVIEVRESIADISTELPCLGSLENPGKLPVQDVIGGTGESRHVTSCHVIHVSHVMLRHVT